MNLVMTEGGQFVEVQGSGEESTFTQEELTSMLDLGKRGITAIVAGQKAILK
jgi:ribonuclease PH